MKLKNFLKEEPTVSSSGIKDQKLLVDQRSIKEKIKGKRWARYNECKKEDTIYFRLLKLALNYALNPITLKKGLNTFPYYKRGKKGFILEDSFVGILPDPLKVEAKKVMQEKGCKLVLFEHAFFTLPEEYFRRVSRH